MRQSRTSGSVGDEGGNILVYLAPMLRVMSEIRRREHGGVKDKAVNSGKKVMNQPERLGINVIKFIGKSWRNWWLSCESGVIKLRIG